MVSRVQQLLPQLGSGRGNATFSLSYNAQAAARSTIVVVAGQEVAVTQAAAVNAPGTPAAPVNFDARLACGGAVTLSWEPPAPIPTSYVIEAGTVSGDRDFLIIDVGLQTAVSGCCLPQTTRYFRVRTLNAAGAGPASDEIAINAFLPLTMPIHVRMSWRSPVEGLLSWSPSYRTTVLSRFPGCVDPPVAPTLNVTVTGSLVSIALSVDSPFAFGAFRLYAGHAPGGSDVGIVDVTTPQLSVSAPRGQYYLRAALVRACGVSQASAEQTVIVQ